MAGRADWRAHEWFVWLFITSVPVMKGILPHKYLKHWCLLVDAMSILSKSSIQRFSGGTGWCEDGRLGGKDNRENDPSNNDNRS